MPDLPAWDVDRVGSHPGLERSRDPVGVTLVGLLARSRDHSQVIGVEGLDRRPSGRDRVVNEIDLSADLVASEDLVILAEPRGELDEFGVGGWCATALELFAGLIEQAPDAGR